MNASDSQSGLDERDGRVELDRRYLHVNLDVTERCNLACVHCPYVWVRDQIDQPATLSALMIERLEREVFPFAARASLSSFHESLMAPETLFAVMDAAARAGVPNIDMHTNGLLLTPEISRRLLSRMNLIMVSAEGATPESYAASRRGGSLERFKRGVRSLTEARREFGADATTRLRLTACMSRRNIDEAADLVSLAHELGLGWVEMRFAKITDVADLRGDEQLCHAPEAAEENFARARERGRELGLRVDLPPTMAEVMAGDRPRPRFTNCLYPWTTIQLSPRGIVIPCCLWHGNDALATFDERPFEEVWNGEGFRRLRRELETSSLSRHGCRECEVHFNLADPRYWKDVAYSR